MANRPTKPWQDEVSALLSRAAELCVEHDVEMDPFVRGACTAYFAARPGLREELVEQQLTDQLEELRRSGRIGLA